jgi:hypothetical protein
MNARNVGKSDRTKRAASFRQRLEGQSSQRDVTAAGEAGQSRRQSARH